MGNRVLVSAIIPTYNRGYVVGRAIESILQQTYPHIEIIVVDDGSSDDTEQKLAAYGDRIRVVHQRNAGPSAARNRGIRASQGEIIAFLDSDDVWLPTKIERQVSLFRRLPSFVPCCLSNGITRMPSGKQWNVFEKGLFYPKCEEGLWLNVTDVLATRFILFCQLVAVRREALERTGHFDESLRFMEDYDLSLRLSLLGPWGFIREPLATMNGSPSDSLSAQVAKEEVCHARYILLSRQRVYATLRNGHQHATSLRNFRRAVNRAHRQLWVARLLESRSSAVRLLGRLFKGIEHYRMAIFRRSPWFPRAEAIPLESPQAIPETSLEEIGTPSAT